MNARFILFELQEFNIDKDSLIAQCDVARNMFKNDRPSSAVDVYCRLSAMPSAFPDLLACYQIALTLPVSSASAERSFSTMRRIKTHLRASMGDERLSSLAIIAVEREVSGAFMENPDKVIDEFARSKRRIDLIV